MKQKILIGLLLLVCMTFIYPVNATSTCQSVTGASNVDFGVVPVNTAAIVATDGQTITGTLTSGCDVGVYVGPGVTGVTVTATITNEHYVGVYVDGGGANVIHSTISNIGDVYNGGQFGGSQYGWGILFVQQGWLTSNLGFPASGEATDNQISLYQKAGIVAFGTGTTVTISSNTVTGNGPVTYIAQNGIEVDSGAVATVSNNRVSGNSYTGSTACPDENYFAPNCYQSGGILLVDSGTVTVQGNDVSKNDIGIWHYTDAATQTATITVSSNNIHDNYGYGLVFDGTNNPSATSPTSQNNIFTNNPVGLLVTAESANAYVISLNDMFMGNTVNAEAIQLPVSSGTQYLANLIIETKLWIPPFPLPHHHHW